MIEAFHIAATDETPLVDFNAQSGQLLIAGTSISQASDSIFLDISNWIDAYIPEANQVTQLIINLDYFNISTSKHLMVLLHKLKTVQNSHKMITVEWHYDVNEDDMLELGQDYEMMVRLPFKYVGHKHASSPVC
jgi:hypothetical protein